MALSRTYAGYDAHDTLAHTLAHTHANTQAAAMSSFASPIPTDLAVEMRDLYMHLKWPHTQIETEQDHNMCRVRFIKPDYSHQAREAFEKQQKLHARMS